MTAGPAERRQLPHVKATVASVPFRIFELEADDTRGAAPGLEALPQAPADRDG